MVLQTEVKYLDVTMRGSGELTEWIDRGWEALVYVLSGQVMIGDRLLAQGYGARLGPGLASIAGEPGARFAFLTGRPHHEPIIHRGPFVD